MEQIDLFNEQHQETIDFSLPYRATLDVRPDRRVSVIHLHDHFAFDDFGIYDCLDAPNRIPQSTINAIHNDIDGEVIGFGWSVRPGTYS
jgi:hypothetical protein